MSILQPYDGVRRLVASSATFQAAAGVANATLALPFTTHNPTSDDFDLVRAIVRMENGVTRMNSGLGNWKSTGSVYLCLERWMTAIDSSDQSAFDTATIAFGDWCSTVILEMEALLDSRAAILGQNPIAIASITTDGEAYLKPAESTPNYDDATDTDTASYKRGGQIWFMNFTLELY